MHHAGAFVAVNGGIRAIEIAVAAVQIGLAHAAGDDADDHLVRPRFAQLHGLDGERARPFADDGGLDLHGLLPPLEEWILSAFCLSNNGRLICTDRGAALIAWLPIVRVDGLVKDRRPPTAAALRAVLDKSINTNRNAVQAIKAAF